MNDDYDFGTLRSLLAATTRDTSSFDDVIRHLINWSWLDDPRVFERWLGYAEAHVGRWPDSARCLTVDPEAEIFLRDVFEWSSLFRAVVLSRTPRFLARFVEAVDDGLFTELRALSLYDVEVTPEHGAALTRGLPGLERLWLGDAFTSTNTLSVLSSTGRFQGLKVLDLGGVGEGVVGVEAFLRANPTLEAFVPPAGVLTLEAQWALERSGMCRALRALHVGPAYGYVVDELLAMDLRDDVVLGVWPVDRLHPGELARHPELADFSRLEARGWTPVTDGWSDAVDAIMNAPRSERASTAGV